MAYNAKCPKLPWMVDFYTSEDGKVYNTQMEAAFANTTLEYLSSLNIKSRPNYFRETQIVSVITPYITCPVIEDMLKLGVRLLKISARNNSGVMETLSKLRAVVANYSREAGKICSVAFALEIKGPEIRTGQLKPPKNKVSLEKGQLTNLTTDPTYEEHVTEDMIFVDYEQLTSVVQPGDKVLLNNGSVTLSAIECVESIIKCIVDRAGEIVSNSTVLVPNVPMETPVVAEADQELIKNSVGEKIDFLFLSGIQNKDGVLNVRDLLGSSGQFIMIISKVENSVAIDNIDKIIEVSDGICLDYDRLMIELPKQKVFLIQKSIIAKCNVAGKPVICSMKISDVKCIAKAEVCDIANVIIDGTDALMIPPECCSKEAIKSISTICKEAEPAVYEKRVFQELTSDIPSPMEAIYALSIAAVESALKTSAAALMCLTSSGRTAKVLSRFRPRCPIIAVTRYARVARQLAIHKGVDALVYLKPFDGCWEKDVENRLQLGAAYGKYAGYIRMGDTVVTVSGSRPGGGLPNNIQIMYASDFDILPRTMKA